MAELDEGEDPTAAVLTLRERVSTLLTNFKRLIIPAYLIARCIRELFKELAAIATEQD